MCQGLKPQAVTSLSEEPVKVRIQSKAITVKVRIWSKAITVKVEKMEIMTVVNVRKRKLT
jgi:hypothetical protein